MQLRHFLLLIAITLANHAVAQEWKNLKSYQKETGNTAICEGCWLTKDREKSSEIWKAANAYNLSLADGNTKYKSIAQIRDFYRWFDQVRLQQGHETQWFGLAVIAAGQLAKVDKPLIQKVIVRNKALVEFVDNGSQAVFEFAFPRIRELYVAKQPLKGQEALDWDHQYGELEQCKVLVPCYQQLSSKALRKLERMAKGKGIFRLGVPRSLRFEGSISDCQARFEHSSSKLLPYYLSKH
jgi:hypothetical protein